MPQASDEILTARQAMCVLIASEDKKVRAEVVAIAVVTLFTLAPTTLAPAGTDLAQHIMEEQGNGLFGDK